MSALQILFSSVQKFNAWVLVCAYSLEFVKYGCGEGFHAGKSICGLEVPLVPKGSLALDSQREGGLDFKTLVAKTLGNGVRVHFTAGMFCDFEHDLP